MMDLITYPGKFKLERKVQHHDFYISAICAITTDSIGEHYTVPSWRWDADVNSSIFTFRQPVGKYPFCRVYAIKTLFSLN